jgi:GNAT superfamily N-acetyltransferase
MTEIFDAPNIKELLDEYAAESSIHGLPHPKAKVDLYKQLETVGILYAIGAFLEETLIGFILVVSPVIPHYSEKISTTESFFVAKEYRKTGAGTKLRLAAEKYAKEICALGLLISAPIGSVLAEVLPRAGYKETNRVFFRSFNGG